jgi:hypothetical protein
MSKLKTWGGLIMCELCLNKGWTVTFEKRQTTTFRVTGKNRDEAFQNALVEVDDYEPETDDSSYFIEEN